MVSAGSKWAYCVSCGEPIPEKRSNALFCAVCLVGRVREQNRLACKNLRLRCKEKLLRGLIQNGRGKAVVQV